RADERLQFANHRESDDGRARDLLQVCFYVCGPAEKVFCVAGPAIVRFSCEPTVDAVTIANQHSTGICGMVLEAVVAAVLGEQSSTLDADFRAILLCRCGCGHR